MIEPKKVSVTGIDGKSYDYIISKVPATVGREIVATYPVANAPKIGEYKVSEEIMLKLMSYVSVVLSDGKQIQLKTKALVDNHCPDWEVLAKLEMSMLEYNTSFFGVGKVSGLLTGLKQNIRQLITQILTDLSEQSSAQTRPVTKS